MKIDNIVERLSKSLEDFELGEGATTEEINIIETEFGVVFPADYRYFLERYGYASWSNDILGICHDLDYEEYSSMPYFTRVDRNKTFPAHFMTRPKNTVVVGPYGGGGRYFLYCANSEFSGKVELLLTELGGKPDSKSWDSFTEFLEHY